MTRVFKAENSINDFNISRPQETVKPEGQSVSTPVPVGQGGQSLTQEQLCKQLGINATQLQFYIDFVKSNEPDFVFDINNQSHIEKLRAQIEAKEVITSVNDFNGDFQNWLKTKGSWDEYQSDNYRGSYRQKLEYLKQYARENPDMSPEETEAYKNQVVQTIVQMNSNIKSLEGFDDLMPDDPAEFAEKKELFRNNPEERQKVLNEVFENVDASDKTAVKSGIMTVLREFNGDAELASLFLGDAESVFADNRAVWDESPFMNSVRFIIDFGKKDQAEISEFFETSLSSDDEDVIALAGASYTAQLECTELAKETGNPGFAAGDVSSSAQVVLRLGSNELNELTAKRAMPLMGAVEQKNLTDAAVESQHAVLFASESWRLSEEVQSYAAGKYVAKAVEIQDTGLMEAVSSSIPKLAQENQVEAFNIVNNASASFSPDDALKIRQKLYEQIQFSYADNQEAMIQQLAKSLPASGSAPASESDPAASKAQTMTNLEYLADNRNISTAARTTAALALFKEYAASDDEEGLTQAAVRLAFDQDAQGQLSSHEKAKFDAVQRKIYSETLPAAVDQRYTAYPANIPTTSINKITAQEFKASPRDKQVEIILRMLNEGGGERNRAIELAFAAGLGKLVMTKTDPVKLLSEVDGRLKNEILTYLRTDNNPESHKAYSKYILVNEKDENSPEYKRAMQFNQDYGWGLEQNDGQKPEKRLGLDA